MTDKEKALAYDEALKRAEAAIGVAADKDLVFGVVRTIFPDLAESEDERIRKYLIEELKAAKSVGELKFVIPQPTREECVAYLEKQKELPFVKDVVLGYPGLYFYDGERMHFQGNPAMEENPYDFAMSQQEKQKEQSITANDLDEEIHRFFDDCIDVHEAKLYGNISERVIPVDCYELTARHFAKWGEKQKEQKPEHFELKAGKWYICHRAFCCRADHLTVKEGERFMCEKDGIVKGFVIKEPEKYFKECSAPAPMEDEQKEQKPLTAKEYHDKFDEIYGQYQPNLVEQKPAEPIEFSNEFENQVSHLLASVLNGEHEYNEGFVKYVAQSLLGYAQKEQESEFCELDTNVEKVIEDVIRVYGKTQGEWIGGYDVDALIVNLRRAFNKKEQKPSTEETELNSIAFLEQMGYTCIPPKKEHQNNSDAPKNALGGALNSPLDKDKNLDDIAQDYVEAVKEYNPEPTWNLMQTAVCYGYHYREGEEQKPAESISQLTVQGKGVYKICPRCKERMVRDDSKVYTSMPPQYGYECPKCGAMEFDTVMYDNPEIVEQKPAEWSEDDEKVVKSLIDNFTHYAFTPDGTRGADIISWLKSLRPSWKPSEEQMEAFRGYIEDFQARAEAAVGGWNNFDVMIQLYEQLKKM